MSTSKQAISFLVLAVCFLLAWQPGLQPEETETRRPFSVGDIQALAGTMQSGYLRVPEKDGIGTSIPITLIHGARDGKCLALIAGIHGYEYPPLLALYRLKEMVDPGQLAGTLILVHIANLPSFQRRTIYYNPFDWKNLNRVFPGDAQGTLSQRIAYVLTEEIVKKCDALIDLHCGDGNEALIPYTYWMRSGNKKLDEMTRQMALAFGISPIIIDDTRSKKLEEAKYLGNTAILLGKPAITTESGDLGRTDESSIRRNISGILSVMRLFQLLEGQPDFLTEPVWIDRYEVVYSKTDGLFYPHVEKGTFVREGQLIGVTTDYLGVAKERLTSPFTGLILYIIQTPPTSVGEPLFEVGRIQNPRQPEP